MRAINIRIMSATIGGFLIGFAISRICQREWIFTLIFFVMGGFLIYKGRYF